MRRGYKTNYTSFCVSMFAALMLCVVETSASQTVLYEWLGSYSPEDAVEKRIAPPAGYTYSVTPGGSFGAWLKGLMLKGSALTGGSPQVYLYNGKLKDNQDAQAAVIDIDVGKRDLQQCADAVMRLRAEYLYAAGRKDDIAFNFTNGVRAAYSEWRKGFRAKVSGNKVSWGQSASADESYGGFRKYLDVIFNYAGTSSLEKELKPVPVSDIHAGDIFIKGGFPGHAVIVIATAIHPQTNQTLFLLAQSYMPAQDIHVLKNPNDASLSPWYRTDFAGDLITPEWTFKRTELKRF